VLLVAIGLMGVFAAAGYVWYRHTELEQRPIKAAQATLRNVDLNYTPASEARPPQSNAAAVPEAQIRFQRSAQRTGDQTLSPVAGTPLEEHRSSTAAAEAPQVTQLDRYAPEAIKTRSTPPVMNPISEPSRQNTQSQHGITSPASSGQQNTEQIRLEALEKSRRIGKLVKQINASVTAGSGHQTETLLRELAGLKGANDPYVLKLRAFWHVHTQAYSAASLLLKRVLASNPADLEANINMAVVEIHTERQAQAKRRLYQLKERYPDDTRVSELLLQLR
jgi:hypothetical protein